MYIEMFIVYNKSDYSALNELIRIRKNHLLF